ncbi:malonyl-CoA decarboxylase [Fodinicurvata sp. EGI_FJ10296]|uniref:malonyl-CoA decarboxylase n=1 Tax=Fodinicurvata sp. EGI_FJ10296 TaxID=3231908 RepID=UPI003453EDBE
MSYSFYQILNSVADRGLELLTLRRERSLATGLAALSVDLISQRGEASGVALAREVVNTYRAMDEANKLAFFKALARDFDPEPDEVIAAADAYRELRDSDSLMRLAKAVESPRHELFRRINMAPEGTATIIEMRRDLGRHLADHRDLRSLDADMKAVLSDWFNRGFLVLKRIDWSTPAVVLEKLIQYEAVHEVPGWDDLRRRLARDRRCYAFFHPALKDEPVIFVQVALVKGMAGQVQPLLARDAPVGDTAVADTAIFYSITNCQEGLRGISFGSFLLKQVIADLQRDWPGIRTFATLSPVPGFLAWLRAVDRDVVPEKLRAHIDAARNAIDADGWIGDPAKLDPVRKSLCAACANYLVREKRGARPLDAVARFHLGNGARLERLNWMGDTSPKGLRQSAGILANYLYKPSDIEGNHEMHVNTGHIVTGKSVESLLKT